MPIQESIETKIQKRLHPLYWQVENESHRHSGPAMESHFKVTVVSDQFNGLNLVKRHQQLYALLAEEMAGEVHALALHLYTPGEWAERQEQSRQSPNCAGANQPN